ncbi:MAG: carboxypeptidase regulatory-like domain-containing protein [Acidobacteria bacterium]|nr:carboxypeptidase regulatory-like domain-containing protein [Acidobacteriota bacterium]
MKTFWLALLLIGSVALAAQEKNTPPEPEPGNVTLTLDEFNRLTELANKPAKKPELPPQPYSMKRAELKFKVDSETVGGTIQLQGEVLKKGVVKVPLSSGMTILDAHQEAKSLPLQLENGTQTAVLSGPAEFSVTLDAVLPLRIDAGRAAVSLPVPSAGSTTLTLTIPGEHTAVNINPGLITNRKSEGGRTIIEATLVPGQSANLWWATRENAAPTPVREVRYLADLKTLISVGEAELTVAALADITVVQGDPAQFEVDLPAGYEITGVTGASLDSSEVQAGVLTLKVNAASQRNHEFLISMERSLALASSKLDAPFLSFKNAQRETGEVLVEGSGTLELTATEGGGLKRMDVKETNPYLRGLAHFPPQAAFRYHKQPSENPTLALEWVRFPDSSVLAAVAESAVVTTMVTSEGKSLTEVRLQVRNQAQPFLKVALPAGASILSADVAGEKVKPVEGPDGNRVPMLRPGFRPTDAYTVSFVFMHSGAPFAKKGGSELSLPRMDVPITLVQWEVFLPEQFKVKDFGGDVVSAELVPAALQEGVALGISGVDNEDARLVPPPAPPPPASAPLNLSLPGQLGGIVVDPSGAIISNARITVTSTDTGAVMNAVTNSGGEWQLFGLPSGRLKVKVDSPGFKPSVQNFAYDANRPGPVSTVLNVGTTMETVEVTSESLSLNGRNYSEFTKLESSAKKQAQLAQNSPSSNVMNLQRRVAGVLPVAVDVPHAGTAFHFVRPLVVDEETKVTFGYKSK